MKKVFFSSGKRWCQHVSCLSYKVNQSSSYNIYKREEKKLIPIKYYSFLFQSFGIHSGNEK